MKKNYLNFMASKIFGLSALLLLFGMYTEVTAQQTGTIKGIIIDATDREALLGANVFIEGTSRGDASKLDGSFLIRNVPAGNHVLIATYLGYNSQRIEVTVEPGRELEITIALLWSGVSGDDIVITAQARGQISAINEQVGSNQIVNIVSSERIRELPDQSAATALSRLPGLSVQDGDKIVIRGMQAKLNTITVNGIQLPSTDMNDRSTNLGFISSNMLDGIEVSKAITPDMDANSIGGSVNLRLREAPTGLRYEGMTQGGYNTQDRTLPQDNYQVWASISNRFFNDRVGAFFQVNARAADGGGDIAAAEFARMGPGSDIREYGMATHGMSNFQFIDEVHKISEYGGSLILDYKLPNGKIVMQNTIANTTSNMARHRDLLMLTTTARQYRVTRDIHDKQLLINSIQAENRFGNLKVDGVLSHAFSTKVTDLRYGDPGENFGFARTNTQPYAYSPFPTDSLRTLNHSKIYDLTLDPNNWETASIFQFAGTRDEEFEQRALTGAVNFELPIEVLSWMRITLKTGAKISQNIRDNDIERTYVRVVEPGNNACAADWMTANGINPNQQLQFVDFRNNNYGRGDYFLRGRRSMDFVTSTSRMDEYIRLASPCWPYHEADSKRDDFRGIETITAGYFMSSFNIGRSLYLMAGFRYENFHMDYKSNFVFQTHGVDGTAIILNETVPTDEASARRRAIADSLTQVKRSLNHFFPNVQARYTFSDMISLRAAYTRSASRPDFISLVPNVFRANSNSGNGGNPYLNPTIADNYDLSLSIHQNKVGLLTLGVFYKRLEDVFYGTTRLFVALPESVNFPENDIFAELNLTPMSSGATINTFMNNPNPAYIRGYELDWQTNLWYLPAPFSSIVFNANYTRIFSEMKYQQTRIEERVEIINRRPVVTYSEVDTFRVARLLHQGDHIINLALGADYKGFSGRISFRLQGDVVTSIGTRPEQDTFAENVYGWDFSIRQKLPIEGLSLSFNGVNITHAPTKQFQYFRRDVSEQPTNQLTQIRYNPRRFELALRYTF